MRLDNKFSQCVQWQMLLLFLNMSWAGMKDMFTGNKCRTIEAEQTILFNFICTLL
jgi:hypothetical protein